MPYRIFSIFDGSTFVVGDGRGDLRAAPDRVHGFFHQDTRFVSRWALTLEGAELESLSIGDAEYFAAQYFLVPQPRSVWENPYLSLIRRRVVRGTWIEELGVMNHADRALTTELAIEVDSDFADMFEVKDGEVRSREVGRLVDGRELVLTYRNGEFVREARIAAGDGWEVREDGFRLPLLLPPRGEVWTSFAIVPRSEPRQAGLPTRAHATSFETTRAELRDDVRAWLEDSPVLETDWDAFEHAYHRSLIDLAALRCFPEILPGASLPAAGLPWFMALFGRDSLITSYQALPIRPELARTTLLALAELQARDFDDFRDAEPGKILHELRFGELTVLGERPHSPYYGSADATPLFLIVLDELERWTGDADLVRRLEPNARAALEWIDRHGDLDGDGFVEYKRRNEETGLENQCWKDSWNSILFRDGSVAEPPIATCEIQGYVYDAKRRCARLAKEIWNDAELAERLESEATQLKERFHEDFWVEDGSYYALALDRDKRQVDSLTSNIGHLLWSGIVEREPAGEVARHLMGPRLFSGWGVRTMAAGDIGYNPIEYHNGTVWPHDCSLIAEGLRTYGDRRHAARICVAMIEASESFAYRLPEVFTGYHREMTDYPVQYPTASRPQAWATGAPLLAIRSLLGLDAAGEQMRSDPWVPQQIGRLELHNVPGRWGRADTLAGEATAEPDRVVG
jgi:glycogen debranching enzyme